MPPPAATAAQHHHHHHPVLVHLNEATKWVVSGTAAAVAAHRRDAAVGWCIIGAVASAFLNKAAKRVLGAPRPATAAGRKADPGMPSSHANSLAFLGTSAALGLAVCGWQVAGLAVLVAAAGLTWLRVHLGLHTPAQVLVGAALGTTSALGWSRLGAAWALPAAAAHPGVEAAIVGATVVAGCAFAVFNLVPGVVRAVFGGRR